MSECLFYARSALVVPMALPPGYGYGYRYDYGFGGYGADAFLPPMISAGHWPSWSHAGPTTCDFGPYAGPAAPTLMPPDRSGLDGLLLEQILALDALKIGLLGEWLTTLGGAKGQGATESTGTSQPPDKFVESPDMFRSQPKSGCCPQAGAGDPAEELAEIPLVAGGSATPTTTALSALDLWQPN